MRCWHNACLAAPSPLRRRFDDLIPNLSRPSGSWQGEQPCIPPAETRAEITNPCGRGFFFPLLFQPSGPSSRPGRNKAGGHSLRGGCGGLRTALLTLARSQLWGGCELPPNVPVCPSFRTQSPTGWGAQEGEPPHCAPVGISVIAGGLFGLGTMLNVGGDEEFGGSDLVWGQYRILG